MSDVAQIKHPTIAITAVWLRRSGDHVVVSVEIDGVWREAIREFHEGPFSHIAEARGADRWQPDATEATR
jgi:hypothetical protein